MSIHNVAIFVKHEMPTNNRLQKLLRSEEYSEFKDQQVILESQFVELTHRGDPIKVVLIGITEELFIVATDIINDLRKSRASVLITDIDPDTMDLELEWVVPNLQVIPVPVHNEHVLDVRDHNDHHRYFLVSSIRGNGSERRVWTKWMKYLAKHNPVPDQFLQEIPKSRISLGSLFHTDKKSSTEMLVKSSLIGDKKKKSSSILKHSKEKNVNFVPRPQFKNLIPIATDLYDTTGIVKEEQKESSKTCFCFPRKKKRVKH